jgi:uncharacterized protein YqeY
LLVESFGRQIVVVVVSPRGATVTATPPRRSPGRDETGDKAAVAALRSTLSAIDNAEAVERPGTPDRNLAIEQLPVGVGAAEMARRELSEDEVERIVRAELAERETAAHAYDAAGRPDAAADLRAQIQALELHLSR